MQKNSVVEVVRALNGSGQRYLIAGGLAVVAHGYLRLTADVDIILDLEDKHLDGSLTALAGLGYRPRAPVPLKEFADAAKRSLWMREKNLKVFSLSSSLHPATEIDLFIESPLNFEQAYGRASRQEVTPGVEAVFLGLDDLILLKQAAGRPKDLDDISKLNALKENGHE
jgi:predicted nucleotidyltransferase